MKSVPKKLLEAAELATSVGIGNQDIESISVHEHGTTFRLKPASLSRVFRENRVSKSKIRTSMLGKELYVSFPYRGVTWSTYVSLEAVQQFQATLESEGVVRIGNATRRIGSRKQLCLPAPT